MPASTSWCLLLAHKILSAAMPLLSTMAALQLLQRLMLRRAPEAAASTASLDECAHSCSSTCRQSNKYQSKTLYLLRTSTAPTSASAPRMSSSCAAMALIAAQQAVRARSCLVQAQAWTRATPPPLSMMACRSIALPEVRESKSWEEEVDYEVVVVGGGGGGRWTAAAPSSATLAKLLAAASSIWLSTLCAHQNASVLKASGLQLVSNGSKDKEKAV